MLPPGVGSAHPVISKPSNTLVSESLILTTGFPATFPILVRSAWVLRWCTDDRTAESGGEAAYLGLCFLMWAAMTNRSSLAVQCISSEGSDPLGAAQSGAVKCPNVNAPALPVLQSHTSPTAQVQLQGLRGWAKFTPAESFAELAPKLNNHCEWSFNMETCTAEIPEVFVLSMWALETVSYFITWHLDKLLKPVILPVTSSAVEILVVSCMPNEASGKPATYLPWLDTIWKMKDEQSHSHLLFQRIWIYS